MSGTVSEMTITGQNGYDISVLTNVQSGRREILLCLHGFSGDQHSTVIAALAERLNPDGIGVVAFDRPARRFRHRRRTVPRPGGTHPPGRGIRLREKFT